MHSFIKLISCLIILLGLVHIGFTFPLQASTATLWFVGAGFAISFAGLLNIVALDRGGSTFTKFAALLVNITGCIGFWLALPILNQPQVYVGITVFLITTICFLLTLVKRQD